jgi:hypothetical protein
MDKKQLKSIMKKTLQLVFVSLIIGTSFAQTGPGGVGGNTSNVLWLRSDDLSLNDGDNITTWADFSTHGNTMEQTDNTLNPIFKTNLINGYPVVRFEKDNGRIRKTNFLDFPSTELTAIYVNKNNGEIHEGILSYATTANNNDFLLYGSDNLAPHIKGAYKYSSVSLNDNNWHIANTSWKSAGGTLEVWKDGSKDYSNTLSDGNTITSNGCLAIAGEQDSIDGTYDSTQAHFGDFTEIIMYNTFLNDAQQIIVSNYLSAKYSTSLASNDYYLQDNNGNGDYDFNVAGIGQANDGSNHTNAQGSSIIRINTPSTLSNGDFLFWGTAIKNPTYIFNNATNDKMRLNTIWRVSKQNNLGTVSINIDQNDLAGFNSCSELKIVVSNSDTFSSNTTYDLVLTGSDYIATDVTFNDGDYFTVEYSNKIGYTGPGGVGDCVTNILWLRSEDLSLSDGSDIVTWSDYSGHSNDVSQSDNSLNPILKTAIINSYPIVRFNKTLNRIRKTSFNEFPSSEITTIYVNKNDNESSDGILSYASHNHNNDYLLFGSSNLSPHRRGSYNSGVNFNNNSWHIANHSWKSDNGESEVWKDGDKEEHRTGFKTNTKITKNGCLSIAGEQDSVDGNYDDAQSHYGDFTEIIMYNTFLNNSRQIIISNYLSAKYDTPLALNNFYTQDSNANGDFDFNVAGIGQATDGSNHIDSQGTGIIRINTPSTLANDDFLFWGEETKNPIYNFSTSTEYTERLNSKWRVSKRNDLGTVSLSVKETDIDLSGKTNCAGVKLIVSNLANFSTKTSYEMSLTSDVYTATNVNFSDGDYFTFEYFNKIVVDGTKFYNGSGVSNVPSINDGCYKLLVKNTADGTLPLTEDCVVKEVEVETGGKLIVNTDISFEITNGLQIDGDVRLLGSAQLVQTHIGTSQNSGNGKLYKDVLSGLINVYQSSYFSPPVSTPGSNTYTISDVMKDGTTTLTANNTPLDINFVTEYDGANGSPISISNFWINKLIDDVNWFSNGTTINENTNFNTAEGYNMKSTGANTQNYTFVGKPNDGDYSISVSANKSSLIGNPYPSILDADAFITKNSAVILGDKLYFWDGKTDLSETHVRGDYSDSYATYAGGVGTSINGGSVPTKNIEIGQAFFIDTDNAGTVTIDNSLRIFNSGPFFSKSTSFPILRIGFEFVIDNNNNTFKRQLAIGFRGLTNNFDDGIDATMAIMHPTDISLKCNNHLGEFVITGIENYNESIEIPLHVKLDQQRNVTFNIDAFENFTPNNIYLKDNQTNLYHSLQNNINLNLDAGDYNNRFSIVFRNNVAAVNELIKNNTINIFDNGNDIFVESNLIIKQATIYNTLGQILLNKTTNNTKVSIPNRIDKGKIIFVKVALINGQEFIRKIIKK